MQRWSGQKKKEKKRKCHFYQNMSARVCVCVCLWRCQQIGDTLDKILSNRSCSPRSGQTAVSKSYSHTRTHTRSSSSSGPDRHHEKLRLRSPSCCPELPTERPRNQAVRTTERETKREKAKECRWRRGRESLFKRVSNVYLYCTISQSKRLAPFHGSALKAKHKWEKS